MNRALTLLTVVVAVALTACTDEGVPDPGLTTTTAPPPSTTTSTVGSIAPTTTNPSSPPGPGLQGVRDHLASHVPADWSTPSFNSAPFSISVCGRTIRIVDADPTDESPNRPQEGSVLTTATPDGFDIGITIYEEFDPDTMSSAGGSLHLCGPTTQTNPTDGWILSAESFGEPATLSDLHGFLVTSSATRTYTDSRPTRYSAGRLFIGMSNGFLIRVNVTAAGTDAGALDPISDLLDDIVAMARGATGG